MKDSERAVSQSASVHNKGSLAGKVKANLYLDIKYTFLKMTDKLHRV